MVGFFYLFVAVFQLDSFAAFLSHAITSGFSSGAAFIIMLTQLKYFFGVKTKATSTGLDTIVELVRNVKDTKWQEALMFAVFLVILLVIKAVAVHFKKLSWMRSIGPMVVCIISILAVVIGDLDGKHIIKTVKHVPKGEVRRQPSPRSFACAPRDGVRFLNMRFAQNPLLHADAVDCTLARRLHAAWTSLSTFQLRMVVQSSVLLIRIC